MNHIDNFNNLIQKKLIQKTNLQYQKDGRDHEPMYTCVLEINHTHEVRSDPSRSKKDAYANVIDKFFATYNVVRPYRVDSNAEVIIDLDNSGDLLTILDHPSNNINAFAAKQYNGCQPTYGTIELAKSLVHDATDLLMAYRSRDIVKISNKNNILLVSKDSAFDSLYHELQSDFPFKKIYFISSKRELEDYLSTNP